MNIKKILLLDTKKRAYEFYSVAQLGSPTVTEKSVSLKSLRNRLHALFNPVALGIQRLSR